MSGGDVPVPVLLNKLGVGVQVPPEQDREALKISDPHATDAADSVRVVMDDCDPENQPALLIPEGTCWCCQVYGLRVCTCSHNQSLRNYL